jgi:hypothetical protein
MDINTEVTAAIDKNLPIAVGDVLRKRLEQAEKDAKELAALKAQHDTLKFANDGNLKAIAELKDQLAKHAALEVRERAVADRERTAEVAELKVRLEAEQRFGAKVAEAMLGLVRNVEFRSSTYGTAPFKMQTSPGYESISSQPTSSNTTGGAA